MLTLLAFLAAAQHPVSVSALPQCPPEALSLDTDGEGDNFDGMSHSGTLLVVRNIGPAPCRIEGLPKIALKDKGGQALPITRRAPVGMHPGPVVLPVGLAPGAEATAVLGWVSGPVYPRGRCFDVATASVTIGGAAHGLAFPAHICGPGAGATFDQPVLKTDPTL